MFFNLISSVSSRDLRILHVGDGKDGDCESSACSFDHASTMVRNGDTIIFEDKKIFITSYPSPMSDLLHSAMFMNVTFRAKDDDTVFDGRLMAGDSMFNLMSASRFCWAKFIGFTFTNFEKPIFGRLISENMWPLIILRECSFVNNSGDMFKLQGGSFQLYDCNFNDNSGKPFKVSTEAMIMLTDCKFERSQSSFFFDCDLTIQNCQFIDNMGSRGGALYLSKVTLNMNGAKFIRNYAKNNGGAVYIRESPLSYHSEIRNCCFYNNRADINGSSIYEYWSDIEINGNSFTGDENKEIFEFKANPSKNNNHFKSDCSECLMFEPQSKDFDPFVAAPQYDIDVDVPIDSHIEL